MNAFQDACRAIAHVCGNIVTSSEYSKSSGCLNGMRCEKGKRTVSQFEKSGWGVGGGGRNVWMCLSGGWLGGVGWGELGENMGGVPADLHTCVCNLRYVKVRSLRMHVTSSVTHSCKIQSIHARLRDRVYTRNRARVTLCSSSRSW